MKDDSDPLLGVESEEPLMIEKVWDWPVEGLGLGLKVADVSGVKKGFEDEPFEIDNMPLLPCPLVAG